MLATCTIIKINNYSVFNFARFTFTLTVLLESNDHTVFLDYFSIVPLENIIPYLGT